MTATIDEILTSVRREMSVRGERLFPYQEAGVRWLHPRKTALLADDPGCIDGAAIVRVNRAGKGFALPLAELHRRFHGAPARGRTWDRAIPTMIRALCDGVFRLQRIVDVLDRGERPVVKLTLASGKTLRMTPDHEVAFRVVTDGIAFVRADALEAGDNVVTNGTPACSTCGSAEDVATYQYAKFRGQCRTCIYRLRRRKWNRAPGGRTIDKDGYVLVSGQFAHPAASGRSRTVREHVLVMEDHLGRFLAPNECVHHVNGKKDDNRLENLELTTFAEHAAHHGRAGGFANMDGGKGGNGGDVVFVPKVDTVVSVVPDGVAHVYDVVCADPHRNFVANGIVVHNCGKTFVLGAAIPAGAPTMIVCPSSVKLVWAMAIRYLRPAFAVKVIRSKKEWRWPRPGEVLICGWEVLPPSRFDVERAAVAVADAIGFKAPPRPWNDTNVRDGVIEALREADAATKAPVEWGKLNRVAAERARVTKPYPGTLLGADEAHRARNPEAAVTVRFRDLSVTVRDNGGRCWLLTGTPLMNRLDDLWTVLQGAGLGTIAFAPHEGATAKQARGQFDIDALFPGRIPERLRTVMLRRRREDVLPDLPLKTRDVLEVELDPETERLADSVVQGLLALGIDLRTATLDSLFTAALKSVERERMSELRKKLAAAKIPALLDLVSDLEEEGVPLVVFADHRAPLDLLAKRDGWGRISGEESVEQKTETVAQFQAGKLKGVGVSIKAGGVGITLTRAWRGIFVDYPWVPPLVWQAEDRLVRIGQKAQKCQFTRLVAAHVLERRVDELLEAKTKLFERTINAAATKEAS